MIAPNKNCFIALSVFAYICAMMFPSCDVLRDKPFEVTAWSPGDGCFENAGAITVSLLFSHKPDRISVERSFSVTEDGGTVKGELRWDDKRLFFIPLAPFAPNKDYAVNLEAEACSENGVNIDKKFEGRFTTRPYGERPVVLAVYPADEDLLSEIRQQIRIEFSEAIDINSCVNDISFSPSMSGSWNLSNDNRTALFTPKDLWKDNELYKMTISKNFASISGRLMGSDYISRFRPCDDTEPPVLLGAAAIDKDGAIVFELMEHDGSTGNNGGVITENASWENGYRINLRFSEPVSIDKFNSVFLIEPYLKFTIEPLPAYFDSITVSFNENPAWGSRFAAVIGSGNKDTAGNESRETKVFRVLVNGIRSKPPVFAGLSLFKQDAGVPAGTEKIASYNKNSLFSTLAIDDSDFPYETSVTAYIELYFETADDALINLFSVMDLFRVETTNTALVFTPLLAVDKDFICTDNTAEFDGLCRIEIKGTLKNSARSGIVSFYIAPGLTDSYSNINQEAMSIQLLK
jgi:hypothetical protein